MANDLHCPFTFTYMRRNNTKAKEESTTTTTPAANPYETNIKTIATVSTVEEFWEVYDHLKRPEDLPSSTDLHVFREGIKPTWEDRNNAKGGKLIVRLPKGLASRYWEEIILALIGAQFQNVSSDEVCGAVLSIRYNEDIIGIWNRNATGREIVDKLRDSLKKILQLPSYVNMEYKPHQAALQDRSSFRNTQPWKTKEGGNRSNHGNNEGISRTRRSGSWGERESKPRRGDKNSGRAWR